MMEKFDIPCFLLSVLGEAAYNRTKDKYKSHKFESQKRIFSLLLQNLDSSDREKLYTVIRVYEQSDIKYLSAWEKEAREKYILRKKQHALHRQKKRNNSFL